MRFYRNLLSSDNGSIILAVIAVRTCAGNDIGRKFHGGKLAGEGQRCGVGNLHLDDGFVCSVFLGAPHGGDFGNVGFVVIGSDEYGEREIRGIVKAAPRVVIGDRRAEFPPQVVDVPLRLAVRHMEAFRHALRVRVASGQQLFMQPLDSCGGGGHDCDSSLSEEFAFRIRKTMRTLLATVYPRMMKKDAR